MSKSIDIMKFKDFKAEVKYEKILQKYGKKAVTTLHDVSPSSGRPNRKTPYKDGWIADERFSQKSSKRVVVWNKTNWQLTHLLENGHFITNKTSGIAWSAPRRHIFPTFKKLEPQYVKEMARADIFVELK